MALRRLLPLCCLAFLAVPATAVGNTTGQVTVFWGRVPGEGTLREACDTGRYTTVIVTFDSVFRHGWYWKDVSGHRHADFGDDIKHCQSKNIPVFLSIGGSEDQDPLPSSLPAADVADHLWNAYLAGRRAGVSRPFGDAEFDGVDFFLDMDTHRLYDELAPRLYDYIKAYNTTKQVQLSATMRCLYRDGRRRVVSLPPGIFSRVHVRFYDERSCSYNHAGLADVMELWSRWTAGNHGSQVYLGLVAANDELRPGLNGMVDLKALYGDLLPNVQKADNYGGVMVWSRYEDKQTEYACQLKYWA